MSTASKPPTVAPGPGAGVGATATLLPGADDGQGIIEVDTGLSPTLRAPLCKLTFGEAYNTTMRVTILPFNAAAAELISSIVPSTQAVAGASAPATDFTIMGTANAVPVTKLQYSYVVELQQ